MPQHDTSILWFRQDLRLADNPALVASLASHRLLPLYLYAPEEAGVWREGAASRWWLHHSLVALDRELRALGSRLVIRRTASSARALVDLIEHCGATQVLWNRCQEPWAVIRDEAVACALAERGVEACRYNSALLHEPGSLLTAQGEPFRVFTPFWRAALRKGVDKPLAERPTQLPPPPDGVLSEPIGRLSLLPQIPWDRGFYGCWEPGERGAWKALSHFLAKGLKGYPQGRDLPAQSGTSRLSPHLHFGEIGPRQIVTALLAETDLPLAPASGSPADRFASEIGWREFGYHLLHHYPRTPEQPLDARFADFPWASDYQEALGAWQRGLTGIPLVDAGMRELWATGWMHNRVRMVVASFLTKNLLVPWQEGARWFWDTLVDADLASNSLGWQWTAGCGADAAPYFRMLNPVLQGERFDLFGAYVKRWVPELGGLEGRFIHRPWEAPVEALRAGGLRLGESYPLPLVDLKASRARALDRFQHLRRIATKPDTGVGTPSAPLARH